MRIRELRLQENDDNLPKISDWFFGKYSGAECDSAFEINGRMWTLANIIVSHVAVARISSHLRHHQPQLVSIMRIVHHSYSTTAVTGNVISIMMELRHL